MVSVHTRNSNINFGLGMISRVIELIKTQTLGKRMRLEHESDYVFSIHVGLKIGNTEIQQNH